LKLLQQKNKTMKIAVPVTSDNKLDSHFGHCKYFKIFSVKNENEIECIKKISPENGHGCKSGIASLLAAEGVEVLLAGGIGEGAVNNLNSAGIKVIRGCAGEPDDLVRLYIEGKIDDSGESCRHPRHHQHEGQQGTCHHS